MRYTKIIKCHFCENEATAYNKQRVPCCSRHRKQETDSLVVCNCGESAEVVNGKFGLFVKCPRCGNLALKKIVGGKIQDAE